MTPLGLSIQQLGLLFEMRAGVAVIGVFQPRIIWNGRSEDVLEHLYGLEERGLVLRPSMFDQQTQWSITAKGCDLLAAIEARASQQATIASK